MGDTFRAVTGQLDYHWANGLWPRLQGLTDDEYLWEPVPNCWSLHVVSDGRVTYDFDWPPPRPAPFTTIAWRMFHVAVGCLAERSTRYFPEQVATPWTQKIWEGPVHGYPHDAAGALVFLETAWSEWRSGLEAVGEAGLWRPIGDGEYDFKEMHLGVDDPFIGLVLHIHREVIHHGAEILCLRDLYRQREEPH